MSAVVRAFITSRIESVNIAFASDCYIDEEDVSWSRFLPPERSYPYLRRLTLSAYHQNLADDAALNRGLVPGLLRNFPQAQALTLSPTRLRAGTLLSGTSPDSARSPSIGATWMYTSFKVFCSPFVSRTT